MLGRTHAIFGITTLAAAQTAWPLLAEKIGSQLTTDQLTGLGELFMQPHPVFLGLPAGPALCVGAATLGALLPDLDAEDSTIQHELGGLGAFTKLGMKILGIQHRGFLHSGVAVVLVMVVSIILGRKFGYTDVGFAFGLGFMSHILLADAMTISGVPLLWPSENKFHLLPGFLRIRTGGPVESLVSILTMIALVYMSPALVPDNFFKILRNILS